MLTCYGFDFGAVYLLAYLNDFRLTLTGVFSERERSRSLYTIARLSVVYLSVCLSSVTLVYATQAVEIFGNISTTFGTLAIR